MVDKRKAIKLAREILSQPEFADLKPLGMARKKLIRCAAGVALKASEFAGKMPAPAFLKGERGAIGKEPIKPEVTEFKIVYGHPLYQEFLKDTISRPDLEGRRAFWQRQANKWQDEVVKAKPEFKETAQKQLDIYERNIREADKLLAPPKAEAVTPEVTHYDPRCSGCNFAKRAENYVKAREG